MPQDPMLPAGTSQADLDNFYGDGSAFCHDCEKKIPLGQENAFKPFPSLHIFWDLCDLCLANQETEKEDDE